MPNLFPAYRILAFIVGVLLTLMVFIGMPMKYFLTEGTDTQILGDHLTAIVAMAHGWIYIIYVIVAFLLARRQGWSMGFTLLMLAAGLIPILIFFVEHQVATRVRAEESLVL